MSVLRRKRRGANAIEFALTFPIAVAVLAGIIDYGWLFFQQEAIESATREGARRGSVSIRAENPVPRAELATRQALDRNGINPETADVRASLEGLWPDERITVDTTVPFTPLFGIVPVPVQLRARLSMRLEAQEEPT